MIICTILKSYLQDILEAVEDTNYSSLKHISIQDDSLNMCISQCIVLYKALHHIKLKKSWLL